jgi:hypothetical protein
VPQIHWAVLQPQLVHCGHAPAARTRLSPWTTEASAPFWVGQTSENAQRDARRLLQLCEEFRRLRSGALCNTVSGARVRGAGLYWPRFDLLLQECIFLHLIIILILSLLLVLRLRRRRLLLLLLLAGCCVLSTPLHIAGVAVWGSVQALG